MLKQVEDHQQSLEFVTNGEWRKFVEVGASPEPPRVALLWITPEKDPVLPRADEVTQHHLGLSVFERWIGSELCRYADSHPVCNPYQCCLQCYCLLAIAQTLEGARSRLFVWPAC